MTSPFDRFDKIYCINLPESTVRWNRVSHQFRLVGIDKRVEQIWATPPDSAITAPALKYPRGEIGVSLSQIKAIIHALHSNANTVLIFEDDVVFENEATTKLQTAIAELPEDWGIFFLGGNPRNPMTAFSPNLYRTSNFVCAHAYALTRPAMLALCDKVMDGLTKYPIDHYTSGLAQQYGYVMRHPICWQQEGESVLRNGEFRDYREDIRQNWNKYKPTKQVKLKEHNNAE